VELEDEKEILLYKECCVRQIKNGFVRAPSTIKNGIALGSEMPIVYAVAAIVCSAVVCITAGRVAVASPTTPTRSIASEKDRTTACPQVLSCPGDGWASPLFAGRIRVTPPPFVFDTLSLVHSFAH